MEDKKQRTLGIDAFRLAAALSVVFVHVGYFEGFPPFVGVEIRLLGRWAVPFFFIVSGYFIAAYLRKDPSKVAFQAAKSAALLAIASILMIPLLFLRFGGAVALDELLSLEILTSGTYFHLWFLSSMAFGLFVFYGLAAVGLGRFAFLVVIASLGLMVFNTYHPGGNPFVKLARYLMCFPFLYCGMIIRWKDWKPGILKAIALVLIGILLENVEAAALWKLFGKSPSGHNFLIGTIPFSLGMFFLSMRVPVGEKFAFISKWGAIFSLGIYIFHPYFIYLLSSNWIWGEASYSALVIPLAFGLTFISLAFLFRMFPWFEKFLAGNPEMLRKADSLIPLPFAIPPESQTRIPATESP